jgi:hypothetical protein
VAVILSSQRIPRKSNSNVISGPRLPSRTLQRLCTKRFLAPVCKKTRWISFFQGFFYRKVEREPPGTLGTCNGRPKKASLPHHIMASWTGRSTQVSRCPTRVDSHGRFAQRCPGLCRCRSIAPADWADGLCGSEGASTPLGVSVCTHSPQVILEATAKPR